MNEQSKFNIKFVNKEKGKKERMEEDYIRGYFSGLASKEYENEMEKDARLLEMIEKAKGIVTGLANNYGVKVLDINPEMVHLLPHEDFIKFSPGEDAGAFCSLGGVFIDEKFFIKWDELSKFMAICHELIHAGSHINVTREELKEKDFSVERIRGGVIVNRNGELIFKGLNEAITVFLTNVCYFNKVKDKLKFDKKKSKSIQKFEQQTVEEDNFGHYRSLEKLFMDICSKITKIQTAKNINERDATQQFIEVYFNGGIEEIGKLLMLLGGGALNNLAKITDQKDKDNLLRIVNFRKKYGLPEEKELNEHIKNMKK